MECDGSVTAEGQPPTVGPDAGQFGVEAAGFVEVGDGPCRPPFAGIAGHFTRVGLQKEAGGARGVRPASAQGEVGQEGHGDGDGEAG